MGIGTLEYSKDWTSPSDFPAVQPDEQTAREDMQCLFNEVKKYINTVLLPGLKEMEVTNFKVDDEGRFVFTDANNVDHAYNVGKDFVSGLATNSDGELVVTLIDGTETNLGKVGGGSEDPVVKVEVTSTGYIKSTYASGKTENSSARVLPRTLLNVANGVAGLDASGKLSSDVLPDSLSSGSSLESDTLTTFAYANNAPAYDSQISSSGTYVRLGNLIIFEIVLTMTADFASTQKGATVQIYQTLGSDRKRTPAIQFSGPLDSSGLGSLVYSWRNYGSDGLELYIGTSEDSFYDLLGHTTICIFGIAEAPS